MPSPLHTIFAVLYGCKNERVSDSYSNSMSSAFATVSVSPFKVKKSSSSPKIPIQIVSLSWGYSVSGSSPGINLLPSSYIRQLKIPLY